MTSWRVFDCNSLCHTPSLLWEGQLSPIRLARKVFKIMDQSEKSHTRFLVRSRTLQVVDLNYGSSGEDREK